MPCDQYPGLFPIGRLDFDTTGLLLFSTDGELGNMLLHPRHHVEKTYFAQVEGVMSEREADMLREGVVLEDGPTREARVEIAQVFADETAVRLTIHEGRKRQVKRMCAHVGHPVLRLHREQFGPLVLGDTPQGAWRLLTDDEVARLRRAATGA